MFSYIVNPNTQEKISLFGQEGGDMLANYVHIYKNIREQNNKQDKLKTESNSNQFKQTKTHSLEHNDVELN
jgi:hypothetical protein